MPQLRLLLSMLLAGSASAKGAYLPWQTKAGRGGCSGAQALGTATGVASAAQAEAACAAKPHCVFWVLSQDPKDSNGDAYLCSNDGYDLVNNAGQFPLWLVGHRAEPPRPTPAPGPIPEQCYAASVVFDPSPVLSFVDGSSTYGQVFNPSWVEASAATGGKAGLLVRTQNCTAQAPGKCLACSGVAAAASVLTFAELLNDDNDPAATPRFQHVDRDSVVFGPHDLTDDKGTEDPRVALDAQTGLYFMMYTCYNSGQTKQDKVTLCLATSTNPTSPSTWTLHGPIGFPAGSKSGALLIREDPAEGPHFMYWGAGMISITNSTDLLKWDKGVPFIKQTLWGNPHVEAGPPPMKLSTGDFLFFHNSWAAGWPHGAGYQPAWVVLNGSDLSQIISRAPEPLWSPDKEPWMAGVPPYTCNVANVSFLEAAHPVAGRADTFRVYFGGSDAVIGSAVVSFARTGKPCNGGLGWDVHSDE